MKVREPWFMLKPVNDFTGWSVFLSILNNVLWPCASFIVSHVVILACPESMYNSDSRQAGMTCKVEKFY
jgi:hypothetical protein